MANSGERIEPPGPFFIPPEGMKLLSQAHGAQMGNVYTLRGYAGCHQLEAIVLGQVDVCPPLLAELGRDFGAHFIAALPDARADGRLEIGRGRAETGPHGIYGMFDNPRHRPAPAGVNRGHGAQPRIHQQNGDAIGSLHGHYGPGRVFEQRVAVAQLPGAAFRRYTSRRVNLVHGGQVAKPRGNIGKARAKAVDQPPE